MNIQTNGGVEVNKEISKVMVFRNACGKLLKSSFVMITLQIVMRGNVASTGSESYCK